MRTVPTPRRRTPAKTRQKAQGHPPLCTPEVIADIEACVKLGLSYRDSCQLAGIATSTFYSWQERAHEEHAHRNTGNPPREAEQRYVDFLEALTRAELVGKHALVERISKAGQPQRVRTLTAKREVLRDAAGNPQLNADQTPKMVVVSETIVEKEEYDWRASFELLRRRYHTEWGDRQRTELTGAGGGPVRMEIPVQNADAEALAELAAAMEESGLLQPRALTEGDNDGPAGT